MREGYHYQSRQHALNALAVEVYKPDAELGIGDDETLSFLAMKAQYQDKQSYVVIPDLNSASIELATVDGTGESVNESDFPTLNYFGSPIGGF